MTNNQTTVTELSAILDRTEFLKPYGFMVQSCVLGECILKVPFSKSHERPGGIVSGMTVMGAADVAMWLAIMTHRGTEELWVTSDMKTAFLRSGRQEDFLCTARILKLGKRTAYGTVETIGSSSGLMAHHVIAYSKVTT
ncbi:PaaI family thioesterase [Geothrix campi]|jgi:acyl-coenzyme A thioesterase PaaI-like protein|uniref:PaaI family thioesterase n=1 Tax=Geothrix campi TaxID=2966450 RepID=UPI002147E753|nr:PaaI family thioesterase [Geothrix sp. SG10]